MKVAYSSRPHTARPETSTTPTTSTLTCTQRSSCWAPCGASCTASSTLLGDAISSWVSNQSGNMPVSGSQLQQALGSDTVNQLAQKFGVDANQASEMLAKILPNLVDHATPNGSAQDADGFGLDDVASMLLKNFMK